MRNFFLVTALAVFGLANVTAQIEAPTYGFDQGDIFLEGNIQYNATNNRNTEVETSNFNISPKAGYFLNSDFAFGVEASYGQNKETEEDIETTNSNLSAGIFGRYYFLDLGKRFKTFTELGVNYLHTKTEIDGVEDDLKANGFGAGLGLGINYFVNDNIAITFGLSDLISYQSVKADIDGAKAVSQTNADINIIDNFFDTAQFGLLFKL